MAKAMVEENCRIREAAARAGCGRRNGDGGRKSLRAVLAHELVETVSLVEGSQMTAVCSGEVCLCAVGWKVQAHPLTLQLGDR